MLTPTHVDLTCRPAQVLVYILLEEELAPQVDYKASITIKTHNPTKEDQHAAYQ
jgi:hypothetical protein